ncbi:MAG: autotransporter outer membrane beta-barrel domain-containing protein, partial [Saezia sp.]
LANNTTVGAGAFGWNGTTLTKTGTGTLILTGANTYSGGTTVNAGTLQGTASSLQGNIANNANLVFDQTGNGTYAGVLSGAGSMTKQGAGTLTLTGANTYSGSTTVAAGTLQGNANSLKGNITNNANLTFNQAVDGTFTGTLTGTGAVNKIGAGTLTLANNAAADSLAVDGGALYIAAGKRVTVTNAVNMANNTTLGLDITSNPALQAASVNFAGGNTIDVTGLSGSSNYKLVQTTGGITGTFDVKVGGVSVGSAVTLNTYVVGSAFKTNGNKDIEAQLGLVWNNPTPTSAHGTFNIASGSFSIGADLTDNSNAAAHAFGWDGTTLTKTGAGTLILTGANTYTGGTTVSMGVLQGNTTSLQGDIDVTTTLIFDQAANGTYAGNLSGTGVFIKQGLGKLTLAGASTFTGNTTVMSGTLQGDTDSLNGNIANNANLVFDQTVNGTYAGVLSGAGSTTKQGAGTLTLTGTNTNTGSTTVAAGTLQGNANSLKGNIANNANLVFDQTANGTYAGVLSGTGNTTKQGAGTLTLTGANTNTGSTTVAAGTLQGDTSSLTGNIVNNATLTFAQAGNGTYNALLTGTTGIVNKEGAGTLTFGQNVQLADLNVNAGSLNVAAGKTVTATNAVTLAGNAILGIDATSSPAITANTLNFTGANTLDITGVDAIVQSAPPLTLVQTTSGITGAYNVTVAGTPLTSTVDIDTYVKGTVQTVGNNIVGSFGLVWHDTSAGNAHGTFNITGSNNFTVSSVLDNKSGTALGFGWDGTTLDKVGTGTLILDAANTYTGLTTVQDGKLVVGSSVGSSAQVAGDVTVNSGATLGGHGQIFGTATIANGATVAPGTSIGTLAVGQIIFQAGSTYEFEAQTGTADKIVVSSALGSGNGTATINSGANLKIVGGAGSWVADHTYTILEANNGVTGVFDNVTKDTAFLNHSVTYNANNIQLLFQRNTTRFAEIGISSNQRNTGAGIESLGSSNEIYQQIVGMSTPQAISAFNNLSGEIHASAKSAMLNNSRYARNAVNQHLDGANSMSASDIQSGRSLWVSMWGHDGHLKDDNNAAKMDNKGYGLMVGADAYSTDKVTAGVAMGYEQSDLDVGTGRQSSADINAIHLMAYGSTTAAGLIDIKGGIGYSWLNADTTRNV